MCAQQRLRSACLGIRPVWSESLLSAWRNIGSSATSLSAQRMPRLIWVFAVGFVMLQLICQMIFIVHQIYLVIVFGLTNSTPSCKCHREVKSTWPNQQLNIWLLSVTKPHSWPVTTTWAASWQNQQCGCAPSNYSDQPWQPPSLIRVFTVRMKKHWVLSYPLSA